MDDQEQEAKEDQSDSQGEAEDGAQNCEGASQAQGEAGCSQDGAQAQADGEAALKEEVASLQKENADLKDQLLRRAADFDNYRKRMIKEKQDAYDYANEKLLQDLLGSLDNFDRALDAAGSATDVKSIAEGVKMTGRNLVKILEEKYNLSSYGCSGDAFNPDEHEAIGSEQGAVADPVIKEVYLKGYKLKDKVIRHAKVMVTMPDGSVKKDGEKSKEKK